MTQQQSPYPLGTLVRDPRLLNNRSRANRRPLRWLLHRAGLHLFVYSDEDMEIRILHHHAPGYGWSFDSPDVPGLIGGTESYDAANAEEAARFALTCAADERGEVAPTDLTFEHYVPVGVAVTA